MMRKGVIIFITVLLVLSIYVYSSSHSSTSLNWLTRNHADSLYAPIETSTTYGEMWNFTLDSFSFTATTAGVYYNFTGMVCGDNNNVICKITDTLNYLNVTEDGVYSLTGHISGEGAESGGRYSIVIAKNFNVTESKDCTVEIDGTTNIDTIVISCIKQLIEGDTISFMVSDTSDPTKEFSIYTMNLNMKLIG